MGRRTSVIGIMVLVLCGILAVIFWPRKAEPIYKGKKLSEWVDILSGSSKRSSQAQAGEAVRAIGTNGLPFYVAWMSYQPGVLKSFESQLAAYARRQLDFDLLPADRKITRAYGAFQALTSLGEGAAPAIPQYVAYATNPVTVTRGPIGLNRPIYGILGLVHVGPPALPAFLTLMTNADARVRTLAVANSGHFYGSTSVLAGLRICLQDPDYGVRSATTNAMMSYTYDLGGPMDGP